MKVWLLACIVLCGSTHGSGVSECFEVSARLTAESPVFAGLDTAVAHTGSLDSATLCLLPSILPFAIEIPATVRSRLQVQGNAQRIAISAVLGVRGSLVICNASVEVPSTLSVVSVIALEGGYFGLSNSTVSNASTPFLSGFGSIRLEASVFLSSRVPIVFIKTDKANLLIQRCLILNHTGEFLQVLSISGSDEEVVISIEQSIFRNCNGSDYLIYYSAPLFTGNIGIIASVFESNDIWLFYFDLGEIELAIAGCSLHGNAKSSLVLYANRAVVDITDSKWQGNSQILFDIKQFTGNFIVRGIEVTGHKYKGIFWIRNTQSVDQCQFSLQASVVSRMNFTDSEWTPGVLYSARCLIEITRSRIEHTRIKTKHERDVDGLVFLMAGGLSIRELTVHIAGTTGLGIAVAVGDLRIADSVLDDLISGSRITLGVTSGSLTAHNVTFTQPEESLEKNLTLGDVQFCFATLGTRLEVKNALILPGMGWYYFDNVVFSQYSVVNISGVLIRDLHIDNIALLKRTDGIMTNITIQNCTLGYAMFSIYCLESLLISNVVATDVIIDRLNRGIFAPTVYMNITCSELTFRNITTRSIISSKSGQVSLRNIGITDCHFEYFVYYQENSDVTIEGMEVRGTTGGLAVSLYSSLRFVDSNFEGLSAKSYMIWGEAVNITFEQVIINGFSNPSSLSRLMDNSHLLISHCSFSNYESLADEGFSIDSGSVTLLDSRFSSFNVALFQAIGCSVSIRDSDFQGMKNGVLSEKSNAAFGGVLGCVDCPAVTVESSSFLNVSAIRGGALAVRSSLGTGPSVLRVSNCEFVMCAAKAGGAVYVQESAFLIESSRFLGNNASATGGAIDSSIDSDLRKSIRNCSFFRNGAREGGAVKWGKSEVAFINVTFQDNSAVYGPNVASFGTRLFGYLSSSSMAKSSGYTLSLIFELQDHYGQVVSTASAQDLLLLNDSTINYRGNQAATIDQGIFNFSELTVYSQPNSRQTVTGVMNYVENEQMRTLYGSVQIDFRDCVPGEVRKADRCEYCFPGNVSFVPSDPDCSFCPKHAFCPGGNALVADPQYWRSANLSSALFKCPLKETCLGGKDSECAEGYSGNVCNECAEGYSRIRTIECEECASQLTLWLKVSFIAVPLCGFYLAVRRASAIQLFMLKRVVFHSQLLTTISYFRAPFPTVVKYFLHSLSYISSLFTSELPIWCLTRTQPEFIRAIIGSAVAPASCALFLLLSRHDWKKWAKMSTSALLFTPVISLYAQIPLLACQPVESERLFLDMSQQCWQGTHLLLIKAVLVPSGILSVLLPAVLAAVMSIAAPQKFDELFPLWRSGVNWRCWELFMCCSSEALACLVAASIIAEQLSQVTYALLIMIVMSVMAVSLRSFAYIHWKLFALAEFSLVIVAVSMGLSAYFIYHSPAEGVTDWLVTGVFVVLNAGYFAVCVRMWMFPPDLRALKEASSPGELAVPPNSIADLLQLSQDFSSSSNH